MTKWKLVPVEPTVEMMRDGMNVPWNKAARHNAVYRAMLEASPPPPRLSDERILEICGFRPESKAEIGADIVRKRWLEIGRAIEREILGGGHE